MVRTGLRQLQVLVGKRALHQEQVPLFLLWEVHMAHQPSTVMWLLSRKYMMTVLSLCLKPTMVATLTIPLEKISQADSAISFAYTVK